MTEAIPKGDEITKDHIQKGKDDPELPRQAHQGYAYIINKWGLTIDQITLRHRRSNDSEQEESESWPYVSPNAKVGPLKFTYETGFGTPFDYWWVTFKIGNETWKCKDSFYCSLTGDDNGNVDVTVHGDSETMTVAFSYSDGCTVDLDKS